MKEKDIYVDFKSHEIILYAEKEDETYDAITSGSYAAAHNLDEFFLLKGNLDKQLRGELQKGNISPVYYYMLMQDMGPGDLADRIGISKRKLRKHFKPEKFLKLDKDILQKYATVFGVTIESMMSVSGEKI
jgi:hypothetical protein